MDPYRRLNPHSSRRLEERPRPRQMRQEGRRHPPQPGAQLVQPEPLVLQLGLPALQLGLPALQLGLPALQRVPLEAQRELLARRPGAYPQQ